MSRNEDQKSFAQEAMQNTSRIIRDDSRMKYRGDPSFLNFLYVLLVITCTGCALWQHGNVYLTAGVMVLAPLMYLVLFIPYWIYPSLWRAVFNGLFFSGVILWGIYRAREVLPDLALVECLSAGSLVFLSGGKSKDRGYLFFISIFLMIYGGLIPRTAYLYFCLCALIVLVVILFCQRSYSLAGTRCFREKKIRFMPRLLLGILVLVLSGVLFRYIFALMPLKNNEVPGYFQTSFLTERENALPPQLQKWFQFRKVTNLKPSADKKVEISAVMKSDVPPVISRKKEGAPMNLPQEKEKSLIEGGSGSAPPGGDLLYYVKSPVLLYHLVRLYDEYDGKTWKESRRFKRMHIRHYASEGAYSVEQQYTVMKFGTLQLPGGFMPIEYFPVVNENEYRSPVRINRRLPYGAYLKTAAELPFKYSVSVHLTGEKLHKEVKETEEEFKQENMHRLSPALQNHYNTSLTSSPAVTKISGRVYHPESIPLSAYRRLPMRKISKRVRSLAKEIVKGCSTPYEKAFALRDHLRKNYAYSMETGNMVPPGKEGSDYFLFELKKGHCEYFACTLAVLARCVGLPARVATGYSPGNYNTLNHVFEVYEYHAHAWTQIFLPGNGWVTMDATPPSALDTDVLPRGLGHLRDPFGDEWKISAPELTQSNRNSVKELRLEQLEKQLREAPVIDQALLKVVKTQEKVEQKVRKEYEKTVKQVKKSREHKDGKLYKLQAYFRKLIAQLVEWFYNGCDFVYSMWLLLLTGILLLIVLLKFVRILFFEYCRKKRFRKMNALEKEGTLLMESDPGRSVLCFYRAYRLALSCTGRDRKNNQELLDLSDELGQLSMVLGESSRRIFLLFYKAEYGNNTVTRHDAALAQKYFQAGRDKLLELFYGRNRKSN